MKIVETLMPIVFVILSILLMLVFGLTATGRTLTQLEAFALHFFSLILGLYGSYMFGRRINKESIREFVKPQARSAFRRLCSLYRSIYRVEYVIDEEVDDEVKIAIIQAIVREQIDATDAAMEDWRDLVPEAVQDLSGNR